jgi:hypothetical protein
MKLVSLITIMFAVSTLLFAPNTKAASTADTIFDVGGFVERKIQCALACEIFALDSTMRKV